MMAVCFVYVIKVDKKIFKFFVFGGAISTFFVLAKLKTF